jgi:hypothetical protein
MGKAKYLRSGVTGSLDLDQCDLFATSNDTYITSASPCNELNFKEFKTDGTVSNGLSRIVTNFNNTNLTGQKYLKAAITNSADLDSCDIFTTNDLNFIPVTGLCNSPNLYEFKIDDSIVSRSRIASNYNNIDLLGNRYLKAAITNSADLDSCDIFTTNDLNFIPVTGLCNSPNLYEFKIDGTKVTRPRNASNFNTIDLLDTNRGYGYIEYKMISPNSPGLFGSQLSLTSSSFPTPVLDNAENTITVTGISCDYIYPNSGTRNITLSDAELRTDQDFTCNINLLICPVVFYDLDSDGLQDIGELNVAEKTIDLLQADGTTLIESVSTDLNGNNCFETVATNTTLKIRDNDPLSLFSTTGGFINEVTTPFNSQLIYVKFGYSSGSLTLQVPPEISFPGVQVSNVDVETCSQIEDITVTDTRFSSAGWTLTATVNNFTVENFPQYNINVANRFSVDPGQITANSGQLTGLQAGYLKTVTSTSDTLNFMNAEPGRGKGQYLQTANSCLNVPAFTVANPNYRSTIYYTLV